MGILWLEFEGELADVSCDGGAAGQHGKCGYAFLDGVEGHRFIEDRGNMRKNV